MESNFFTYRKAAIKDIEMLTRVRVEFISDVHNDITDDAKAEMYAQNKAYFEETLADNSFAAYLAFDGETLAGLVGVNFYKTPPNLKNKTGKTAYISNVYTRHIYCGRGLATRLLTMAMDEARGRGCGKAALHASAMGRPIYIKYGYFAPDDVLEYYF